MQLSLAAEVPVILIIFFTLFCTDFFFLSDHGSLFELEKKQSF